MDIVNFSPFPAAMFPGVDVHNREYVAVVLSATFEAQPGTPIVACAQQSEVHASDQHFGEPGKSSIRYEAQFAPDKQRVDVLVVGHAKAPPGRMARSLLVQLRVADILKRLQVVGNRVTYRSPPEPYDCMPVVYERAYGGVRRRDGAVHLENPVGVGFDRSAAVNSGLNTIRPNVFYPGRDDETAGLGVVARNWQPRLALAGTYDEAWLAREWPFLPRDFQLEHFQAAPRDQQSSIIQGGELVELHNMTPEGVWSFRLPILDVPLRTWSASEGRQCRLRLDTVVLEPDVYRITLVARAKIMLQRSVPPLRELILGHVKDGWWRARLTAKRYFDPSGLGGGVVGQRGFS